MATIVASGPPGVQRRRCPAIKGDSLMPQPMFSALNFFKMLKAHRFFPVGASMDARSPFPLKA